MSPIVFALPGYEALSDALSAELDGVPGVLERALFPDGERYLRLETKVHDRDVVLVGGTVDNDATLSLYDLGSAVVHYGARRLSLVIPYFGYSTMERATRPGEVVTAKTRARLFSSIPAASAGNRVFLFDLHSEGIPHYFEGPSATHVYAKSALYPAIRKAGGRDFVLASTDAGRAKWVESLANDLRVDAAFIIKRRVSATKTEVNAISANVDGRTVVIYDDMIRTGGSLRGAAKAYLEAGATRLVAVCTHGVFPGDSFERLRDTGLFDEIIATDSHPRAVALEEAGLHVVPIGALFAEHLV